MRITLPASLTALRALLAVATVSICLAPSSVLATGCKLGKLAEVPITMVGLRPTIPAKINDTDVRLLVDSGSFYSSLSPAAATELKLHLTSAPPGLSVEGV